MLLLSVLLSGFFLLFPEFLQLLPSEDLGEIACLMLGLEFPDSTESCLLIFLDSSPVLIGHPVVVSQVSVFVWIHPFVEVLVASA